MPAIKIFAYISLGLLAVFAIFALSIDPKWKATANTKINVSPSLVFPYINTFKRWPEWTVWNNDTHPEMKIKHEGAEMGVGAIQRWQDSSGDGVLEITHSKSPELMQYSISMDQGAYLMDGKFELSTEDGNSTHISWSVSGDTQYNLIERLVMLAYRPVIEKNLELGLVNLKKQLESKSTE